MELVQNDLVSKRPPPSVCEQGVNGDNQCKSTSSAQKEQKIALSTSPFIESAADFNLRSDKVQVCLSGG